MEMMVGIDGNEGMDGLDDMNGLWVGVEMILWRVQWMYGWQWLVLFQASFQLIEC